jgi:hypothetical protein
MHLIADQPDISATTVEAVRPSQNENDSVAQTCRRAVVLHRMLHEPLLHYLVIGAVLFGLGNLFDRSTKANVSATRIEVSAAEIQRIREVWIRQRGFAPDASQMKNLVGEYIREEVLYREAVASNLDRDDTIIRRRLVEKMEFLSQGTASNSPSGKDLQEYFQANRDKFRIPAQVALWIAGLCSVAGIYPIDIASSNVDGL